MNKQEAIKSMNNLDELISITESEHESVRMAISALEKQIPKKVYHFLEDDTFETTCCGYDVTNQDFDYCPNCGQSLGDIEEVEDEDE